MILLPIYRRLAEHRAEQASIHARMEQLRALIHQAHEELATLERHVLAHNGAIATLEMLLADYTDHPAADPQPASAPAGNDPIDTDLGERDARPAIQFHGSAA